MCGIVGYVGPKQAAPILLEGLTRLEYRGYDSAGLAVISGGELRVVKARGRLDILKKMTDDGRAMEGTIGIGHTRWATHGQPSDENSHPHISGSGNIAIVHNGIIENYIKLKAFLEAKGFVFASETDSEVIAHLMEYYYEGDIVRALSRVIERVEGSYALGIMCVDKPDELIAVRKDSPLIIGLGEGENFIASDIPAVLKWTRRIIRMDDCEIAVLRKDSVTILNTELEKVEKTVVNVDWDVSAAEKGGYEHFMIKEIMEEPDALRRTISPRVREGRVFLDGIKLTEEQLKGLSRIYIVACGSAYHTGVVGKYVIERMTRLPVVCELASEFRYCDPIVGADTLVIIISQSGETADSIAALREAKRRGARTLAIVNVVGSTIACEADDAIYTWAGPEIAVATTKAYSAQLAVLVLISIYMADCMGTMDKAELQKMTEELLAIPATIEKMLTERESAQYFASIFFNSKDIFFIGRNLDYAIALEGSLKLKEISYIHSEAYAAGELKHGTISLIEEGTLVVAICTATRLREKMISNIKEVKARGAVVLALAVAGDEDAAGAADHTIFVPAVHELLRPIAAVVPLQLFAYYVASMKGCDIDKPRNLAKSVTVE